jgi:hypothetical protein
VKQVFQASPFQLFCLEFATQNLSWFDGNKKMCSYYLMYPSEWGVLSDNFLNELKTIP